MIEDNFWQKNLKILMQIKKCLHMKNYQNIQIEKEEKMVKYMIGVLHNNFMKCAKDMMIK